VCRSDNIIPREKTTYGEQDVQSVYLVLMTYCRSTLVCNMIAYVEFYRPTYFLLENVSGILEHSLKEKTVASGVVKFIYSALIALKYDLVLLHCSLLIPVQLPSQI